jgi:uncharacterized membrane protein YidH (DUF202 family)
MALEPTLPTERTRLAWQRTTLAGVVCLLGALRLLAEVSVPLLAVVGIALLLGTAVLVGATVRRAVRGRQLTTHTGVGRNAALLSGVVCLATLVATAFVVLA